MDYEKKYKNALEWARQVMNGETGFIRKEVEEVFPELAQSEDERIRKALIENFKWFCGDYPETSKWGKDDDLLVKDIIAWLEKQCEQKPIEDKDAERASADYRNFRMSCGINDPVMLDEIEEAYYEGAISRKSAEWSEEDETGFTNTIIMLKEGASHHFIKDDITKAVDWLKSLKDRVKPKHEWSEEDEKMANDLIEGCILCISSEKSYHIAHTSKEIADWLKSLKDRMQGKED